MSDRNEYWDGFKFKDTMEAKVFDINGDLKQLHIDDDLITSAGKAAVASLLYAGTTVVSGFTRIVIGSGNTAANVTDTALVAEGARGLATGSRITTSVTNDTAQLVYVFSSGNPAGLNGASTGTRAIEESGIINQVTTGQLLARQVFSPLNIDWDGGDSLQITWKVQIS